MILQLDDPHDLVLLHPMQRVQLGPKENELEEDNVDVVQWWTNQVMPLMPKP